MSTRTKRIESMIVDALREAFIFELENPELSQVEITSVSMTPDLRVARVNYVLSGVGTKRDETREAHIGQILKRVSGFLRSCVTGKVQLKYSPELVFYYDEGREKELAIARILHDLENEQKESLNKSDS